LTAEQPEPPARQGGILLHPTSLPGRFGIGDLGPEARAFLDFLAGARQQIWQVLPLGHTGYGDSPYQCFSAFAGNPLLVSPDDLVAQGLLTEADLGQPSFPDGDVDFGAVHAYKAPLLRKAWASARSKPEVQRAFERFGRDQAAWLDDYALFVTVREALDGASWTDWPEDIRTRRPEALARWRAEHADAFEASRFGQYLFFTQWDALKGYGRSRGVSVMGDIPIFVSHDSSDVWAHPELFRLAADGRPEVVAGVPPDYFSATGQLWGNPLYRWDVMAKDGYRWWVDRLRATLHMVDLVRLDHFRGFEAYWEVPAGEETAVRGRWVKGPGAAFFEAVRDALGALPIVAEDLGVITPEVEALRDGFGFPGMCVLQFAWGGDPRESHFYPHNFPRRTVAYTGTHDNDTTVGWYEGGGQDTRTPQQVEHERHVARKYLRTDGREIHWDAIRAVVSSVAEIAIVPLQDVLGLGGEARMNLPGRPDGNWQWRYRAGQLTSEIQHRLAEMADLYGRGPRSARSA
jgi:4-alpha-glucanotransferase